MCRIHACKHTTKISQKPLQNVLNQTKEQPKHTATKIIQNSYISIMHIWYTVESATLKNQRSKYIFRLWILPCVCVCWNYMYLCELRTEWIYKPMRFFLVAWITYICTWIFFGKQNIVFFFMEKVCWRGTAWYIAELTFTINEKTKLDKSFMK